VLNEQSSDAADLFRRLSKAGFKLERSSGEGVLFGVLAELESAGLIVGDWRESGPRDVKYYRVTREGEAKLQIADEQIAVWIQAVRVTD
jgi:DNA-binding PadR family transcriptional regulator